MWRNVWSDGKLSCFFLNGLSIEIYVIEIMIQCVQMGVICRNPVTMKSHFGGSESDSKSNSRSFSRSCESCGRLRTTDNYFDGLFCF